MKKVLHLIKKTFSKKNEKSAALKKLESEKDKMKAELHSLYELEFLLKKLNNTNK